MTAYMYMIMCYTLTLEPFPKLLTLPVFWGPFGLTNPFGFTNPTECVNCHQGTLTCRDPPNIEYSENALRTKS